MKWDLFAVASLANINNCMAIVDFCLVLGMLCFSVTGISIRLSIQVC